MPLFNTTNNNGKYGGEAAQRIAFVRSFHGRHRKPIRSSFPRYEGRYLSAISCSHDDYLSARLCRKKGVRVSNSILCYPYAERSFQAKANIFPFTRALIIHYITPLCVIICLKTIIMRQRHHEGQHQLNSNNVP